MQKIIVVANLKSLTNPHAQDAASKNSSRSIVAESWELEWKKQPSSLTKHWPNFHRLLP
jgi:hypothetical protein